MQLSIKSLASLVETALAALHALVSFLNYRHAFLKWWRNSVLSSYSDILHDCNFSTSAFFAIDGVINSMND